MIRPALPSDFEAILSLNAEWEHVTSPLDARALAHLHEQAAYHRVLDEDSHVVAFLLAFREGADYDSPNYRWFDARQTAFLYVDRLVVAHDHQGRGCGAALYDDLFAYARAAGIDRVVCEIDADPPNEASRRFHDRHGFAEVGEQWVAEGTKRVSLRQAWVRSAQDRLAQRKARR